MMRYSAIPWPWVGLAMTLALLGQEALFTWLGANPSLAQTSYRMLVMTIGATSLALILLPPRRPAYLLGFLVCAGLMGWALWLQYGMGLDPCPLCALQRIAVIAIGIVFLIAGLHNPGRTGAAVYAGSDRHHRRRSASSPRCGTCGSSRCPRARCPPAGWASTTCWRRCRSTDVLSRVFKGSGECAEQAWVFLGLAIPSWTFVFFVAMIAAAFALIRRD